MKQQPQSGSAGRVALAAALIFGGCCANVVTLELITRHDAGAGNVVTFAQFAFVAAVGLLGRIDRERLPRVRLVPRVIPLSHYLLYVVLFFTVSVLNNAALGFHIALPFHMIFRSGSLVTSLVLGALLLGKRYRPAQVIAVIAVTAGILLATMASMPAGQLIAAINGNGTTGTTKAIGEFLVGIGMLATALVLSSVLGIFQEHAFAKHGRNLTQEHQFYSHFFSLPFFAGLLPDVLSRVVSWREIAVVMVPIVGWRVSLMWVYLALNMVTQWVCISGVFMMTGAAGALTMTLTISLRKFVSLLISIVAFGNPFTLQHWLATVLVFGGALLYSLPPSNKQQKQPGQTASIVASNKTNAPKMD